MESTRGGRGGEEAEIADLPRPPAADVGRYRAPATLVALVALVGIVGWIAAERLNDSTGSSPPAGAGDGARAKAALPAAPVDVTEIALDGAPTVIAAGGGEVWVIHSGNEGGFRLAQIDPSINTVVTETPLYSYPTDVVAGPDHAYVAVDLPDGGGKIMRIGRWRGETLGGDEITLAEDPNDLAMGDGSLWVATRAGTILEVDLRTKRVTAEIPAPSQSVAADGHAVWGAAVDGEIAAFEARSHRRTKTLEVGWNVVGMLAGNGYIWAAQQRPDRTYAVLRIDAGTGTLASATVLPRNGPGHLALGGGFLWVTQNGPQNGDGGSVVRIDPNTGEIVDEVRVGVAPTGIAYGAGAAWVANFGDDAVARLDPDD